MQPEPSQTEAAIDHGTPGEEGHWRTFYAKWLTEDEEGKSDGVGVTPQDVIDQVIAQLPPDHASTIYLEYALDVLNGHAEPALQDPDVAPAVDDAGLPPQAWSQPDTGEFDAGSLP